MGSNAKLIFKYDKYTDLEEIIKGRYCLELIILNYYLLIMALFLIIAYGQSSAQNMTAQEQNMTALDMFAENTTIQVNMTTPVLQSIEGGSKLRGCICQKYNLSFAGAEIGAESTGSFDAAAYDFEQGNTYFIQSYYGQATDMYSEAITKTKLGLAAIWYNKGNALYYSGEPEAALMAYDHALEINSDYANAWENKGHTLEVLGRSGEANEAFSKAEERRRRENT
jgi:tetratricopeptide (TPR) repeat protein